MQNLMPSVFVLEIASNWGAGCYFFLSMYDNAAKITSKSVKTSIVFIRHHPLSKELEGIKKSHPSSFFDYTVPIYHILIFASIT